MMCDYLYDNTFSGYLTAIYKLYEMKAFKGTIYRESLYHQLLYTDSIMIHSDHILAERVMKGILLKLGEEWLDALYKVFLSELPESDSLGFGAIREGLKHGKHLLNDERHDTIQPFLKISRKVSRETHSFLGYIRFSKLDNNIYFSEFQPTYNILPLLAPHFADRLKDQSWVITDSKRKIAAFYDQSTWHINPLEDIGSLKLASGEEAIQQLWRGYFESLAIAERTNLKLQQQKIPKKYWRFFTEDIGVLKQRDIIK